MTKQTAGQHTSAPNTNQKILLWALSTILVLIVIELIGGILSGSLTLIAEAGHMGADAFAVFLSWLSLVLAKRPADAKRTFGYHRLQVLAALLNGLSLLALTVWIIYEALIKIFAPTNVDGQILLYIGLLSLVINLLTFFILHQGEHTDLNIRSALIHVLSDLLGSLAAVIAGVIILYTGYLIADPLLSLVISVLLLKSIYRLIADSVHILLEGSPPELDQLAIINEVMNYVPEVIDVHHLHLWTLYPGQICITLHIKLLDANYGQSPQQIIKDVKEILASKFAITHATIQVEQKDCLDNPC